MITPPLAGARAFHGRSMPLLACVILIFLGLATVSRHSSAPGEIQTVEANSKFTDLNAPIIPIEVHTGLNPKKVALGEILFHDPRLSRDNRVSCSSCHNLETGGANLTARSAGANGVVSLVNTPSVFNSSLNFSQFWDGRAETLESQIDGPIESSTEMGSSWPEVTDKLKSFPEYFKTFGEIYRDGINGEHVRECIAEFERSLLTPNSRFDRYLRHDARALSSREQKGYSLFRSFGCASCHQGMNIGGNMYQKMGVLAPYFTDSAKISKTDLGRYNVTGDRRDLYMFKVPSLRNVALTAPYFHDGSADTLEEAVYAMAKYQLGRPLSEKEAGLIVDFLYTLTGERNGKPL